MFRVQGLDPAIFRSLIGLPDEALAQQGVQRCVVDANPGYPDRIGVCDLDIGETALLLNYEHQPANTPYRASHAIFISEREMTALDLADDLPAAFHTRPISLRAFDEHGTMLDADLSEGDALLPIIERFFSNPDIAYLHAHYAKTGCYAARIIRT